MADPPVSPRAHRRRGDVWTYDIDREIPTPLRLEADQSAPLWIPPGGKSLTVASIGKDVGRLFEIDPERMGDPQMLATLEGSARARIMASRRENLGVQLTGAASGC